MRDVCGFSEWFATVRCRQRTVLETKNPELPLPIYQYEISTKRWGTSHLKTNWHNLLGCGEWSVNVNTLDTGTSQWRHDAAHPRRPMCQTLSETWTLDSCSGTSTEKTPRWPQRRRQNYWYVNLFGRLAWHVLNYGDGSDAWREGRPRAAL